MLSLPHARTWKATDGSHDRADCEQAVSVRGAPLTLAVCSIVVGVAQAMGSCSLAKGCGVRCDHAMGLTGDLHEPPTAVDLPPPHLPG